MTRSARVTLRRDQGCRVRGRPPSSTALRVGLIAVTCSASSKSMIAKPHGLTSQLRPSPLHRERWIALLGCTPPRRGPIRDRSRRRV